MARIKIASEKGEAVYHCMTRVVNGERLIDDVGKEVLRKQVWQVQFPAHLEVKGRSKGQSAAASIAYITASRIQDVWAVMLGRVLT